VSSDERLDVGDIDERVDDDERGGDGGYEEEK